MRTRLMCAAALMWCGTAGSLRAVTPGSVDRSFQSRFNSYQQINCLARQRDGKVIVGGTFNTIQGARQNGVARLLRNGRLDRSFNPGDGIRNGTVRALAIQADGKILVGGEFEGVNRGLRPNLERINPDGSLDHSFSGSVNGRVEAILVNDDGTIVIGGAFTAVNTVARVGVARLLPSGALDTTFVPTSGAAGGSVHCLAPAAGGRLFIGGNFTHFNGVSRPGVARVLANGGVDGTFTPGTGATSVLALAVDSEGRVLLGENFTAYAGNPVQRLVRATSTGAYDPTFNTVAGPNASPNTIVSLRDGTILIGGGFTTYAGSPAPRVARVLDTGMLDSRFKPGSGPNSFVGAMVADRSGVLIGGTFSTVRGVQRAGVARLTLGGYLDRLFNPRGAHFESSVLAMVEQANGRLVIGGYFSSYGGRAVPPLIRLLRNGRLDTSFRARVNGSVHAIAMQADGRILIGGDFTEVNDRPRNRLARLLPSGQLDPRFSTSASSNDIVYALAQAPDGTIFVGGRFTIINGVSRSRLARLRDDGTLDTSFAPSSGVAGPFTPYVSHLIPQSNGRVLICGSFTSFNGTGRNYIARVLNSGALDGTFNPGTGANASVQEIAPRPGGGWIVVGDFTTFNDLPRPHVCALLDDGTVETTFLPAVGFNEPAFGVAVDLSGGIVVVGEFSTYRGLLSPGIARLEPNGDLDAQFDCHRDEGAIYRLLALRNGHLAVSGEFSQIDNHATPSVALLFSRVEAAGKRFEGAMAPVSGVPWVAGAFAITFSRDNLFSAVIRQWGLTTVIRGGLQADGSWSGAARRSDGSIMMVSFGLHRMPGTIGDFQVGGTVSTPEGNGFIGAQLPFHDRREPLNADLRGYYTAVLPQPLVPDPTLPEGIGFLAITQGRSGRARLAGAAGDGRAFTASTRIGAAGLIVVYLPLRRGSHMVGQIAANQTLPERFINGTLTWYRPPDPSASSYAGGFVATVLPFGGLYAGPRNVFLGLSPGPNNGEFSVQYGHLISTLTRLVTIDRRTASVAAGGSVHSLRLRFNQRTGLFWGSFRPPSNTRRANFRGISVGIINLGLGFSLFPGSGDTPPLRSARIRIESP